jgi:hypothetical protein
MRTTPCAIRDPARFMPAEQPVTQEITSAAHHKWKYALWIG